MVHKRFHFSFLYKLDRWVSIFFTLVIFFRSVIALILFGLSKGFVLKTVLWPIMIYYYKLWLGCRVVSLALIPHLLIDMYTFVFVSGVLNDNEKKTLYCAMVNLKFLSFLLCSCSLFLCHLEFWLFVFTDYNTIFDSCTQTFDILIYQDFLFYSHIAVNLIASLRYPAFIYNFQHTNKCMYQIRYMTAVFHLFDVLEFLVSSCYFGLSVLNFPWSSIILLF